MNDNPKISMKIGKYLREISVIVIGVAITMSASQWINRQSEKRDIRLYLNSIKMELEEIIPEIDDEIRHLKEVERYADYLWSQGKKSVHPDSIRDWEAGSIVSQIRSFVLPTTAFEMFKISGTLRLMEDKELYRSIWTTYNYLEMLQKSHDSYYKTKKDFALKEFQLMMDGNPSDIPMYDFFISHGNSGLLENCQAFSEILKEIVAKLERIK